MARCDHSACQVGASCRFPGAAAATVPGMEALPLILLLLALYVVARLVHLAVVPSARQIAPQQSAAGLGPRTATAP